MGLSKKLIALLLVLTVALLTFAPVALAQDDYGDPGGAAAAGFGVLTLVCGFFFFVLWLAAIAFWIWMIVDVVKREEAQFPNSTGNSKVMWLLIVLLLGVIGAIVYYFAIKRKAPLPK